MFWQKITFSTRQGEVEGNSQPMQIYEKGGKRKKPTLQGSLARKSRDATHFAPSPQK